MKQTLLLIVFTCCLAISDAGILDHVIYNTENRYQLDELDGIVAIKIRKFYAFSDLGLASTVLEERKNAHLRIYGREGASWVNASPFGSESVYTSSPGQNETLQLLRNTQWLFDAEITQVISGEFETNLVFIAMRPSRAYDYEEWPQRIVESSEKLEIVFGLVRMDEKEFRRSFRGQVCYLNNDYGLLDIKYRASPNERFGPESDYEAFFKNFHPSPCYVAREVGVRPLDSTEKSKLIQKFEALQKVKSDGEEVTKDKGAEKRFIPRM